MVEQGTRTETFVVIGQGYWGKGTTVDEAKKQFRREGGALSKGYAIMAFDADTEFHGIDDHGYYEFTGNPPEITRLEALKRK